MFALMEVVVIALVAVVGMALLVFHRRLAERLRSFTVGLQRRIERRYPRRLARWYFVGPLWFYKLQVLLAGTILLASAVLAARERFR